MAESYGEIVREFALGMMFKRLEDNLDPHGRLDVMAAVPEIAVARYALNALGLSDEEVDNSLGQALTELQEASALKPEDFYQHV